ncbi:MAG: hypothetical protein HGA82_00470, partial [Anaerolineales bacterium]|nr:hypothetical protein [Anaerolineales bacterium]
MNDLQPCASRGEGNLRPLGSAALPRFLPAHGDFRGSGPHRDHHAAARLNTRLVRQRGGAPTHPRLRSNGGLFYTNGREFEAMLDTLLDNPVLADELGENGRAFYETHYH